MFGDGDFRIDLDSHIDSAIDLGRSYEVPENLKGDRLTLGPIWCVNDLEVFEIVFKLDRR